jgi:hypothetical protein
LANYPRILVAPEEFNFIEYKGDFMSDFDGMMMLNYFDGGFGLIRSGLKQDQIFVLISKADFSN